MNRSFLLGVFIFFIAAGISNSPLHAGYVYPLKSFTGNGGYSDSLDLVVEVSDSGAGHVDFTFLNKSLFNSCIAAIYFDDAGLLSIANIINGPETSFFSGDKVTPRNLPAGKTIGFEVSDGLWADSYNPSPKNGVNSLKNTEEWVTISCNLLNGSVFPNVINQLNAGSLRIGAHIIALPDGSSESAIIIPEPITIYLLGLSAMVLLRKRTSKS